MPPKDRFDPLNKSVRSQNPGRVSTGVCGAAPIINKEEPSNDLNEKGIKYLS